MSCVHIHGPFLMPLGLDAPLLSMVALVCHCRRLLVNARYGPLAPRHMCLTRCAARPAWFAASLGKPNFARNVAPTFILLNASCNNVATLTTAFRAIARSA